MMNDSYELQQPFCTVNLHVKSEIDQTGWCAVCHYLGIWEGVFKKGWQPGQKGEEGACCAKMCNNHSTAQYNAEREIIVVRALQPLIRIELIF